MAILSGLCPKHIQGSKSFPSWLAGGWEREQEQSLPPPPPVLILLIPPKYKGLQPLQLLSEGIFHGRPEAQLQGRRVSLGGSPSVWVVMAILAWEVALAGQSQSLHLPSSWMTPRAVPGHVLEKMALSITSHKLPLGGWKMATKGSCPKTWSSLRCLKSRDTKLPGPFPGYRLVYNVAEIQGHKLKARGAEPRLRLAFPWEKSKWPCV